MTDKLRDTARLCVHTMTTRPLNLEQAVEAYAAQDIRHITLWREHVEPYGVEAAARIVKESGLKVTSLCRGGFFVATGGAAREQAKTDNRKIIDEAAALGAPLVVLVCGADPEVELPVARQQILDGIAAILPHAEACGIKLAIEPLHPMYADTRSAVSTLDMANNMVMALANDFVGVAIDVYHVWWDSFLRAEIQRAGRSIFAFHVCDWRSPTRDLLNDRAMMGQGCINLREIRGWVEQAGFTGPIEVEIFSEEFWEKDQTNLLRLVKNSYLEFV